MTYQHDSKLDQALRGFPTLSWLSEHTHVHDRDGVNVYADCPICDGRKKLGVRKNPIFFHCFKCDEGGRGGSTWNGKTNLIGMMKILERLSYREAVSKIFKMTGFPELVPEQKITPKLIIPEDACPLKLLPPGHVANEFLRRRHCEHLIDSCYLGEGKYRGRVIMPCQFLGDVVGFEAKTFKKSGIKSLFPEWFYTSDTVYTTTGWGDKSSYVYVTESVLDAETIKFNAIGIYGSILREWQIPCLMQLREQGITDLVWALDYDAWWKQAKAIVKKTAPFFRNHILPMPPGSDPNSLGCEAIAALLTKAILIEDEFDLAELSLEKL